MNKRLFNLICLIGMSLPLHAVVDLGVIERTNFNAPKLISVGSPSPELAALCQHAFDLHGGFKLASQQQSTYALSIHPRGGNAVEVQVDAGHPRSLFFRGTATGGSLSEAALRGCDHAVKKILGTPGFFAGKLVFVSRRSGSNEAYTTDLMFQRVKQITHDRSDIVMPRWSPDGARILYTSYARTGFPDIYLADMQGNRKSFAAYKGTNSGGTFSPNGNSVAMILSSSGEPELYVSNAVGGNTRRLTRSKSVKATPTWAPDGDKIAFTCDLMGRPQLYTISVNGGKMERIQTNVSRYSAEPSWNPINRNLMVFTAAVSKGFQIALYDFSKHTSQVLTSTADSIEASWLNDGRHIIFTRRQGKERRLFILDTESGREKPLHSPAFGDAAQASFCYR